MPVIYIDTSPFTGIGLKIKKPASSLDAGFRYIRVYALPLLVGVLEN